MFSEASGDPGDGTTVIGSIIISGTATDPNDEETLDLVEVRIDAGSWEEAEGTTDWEFGLDTTACRMGSTSCHPGPMT